MQAMSLAEDNQEVEQTDDISGVHDSLNKLLDIVQEQGRQLEELKQVMNLSLNFRETGEYIQFF